LRFSLERIKMSEQNQEIVEEGAGLVVEGTGVAEGHQNTEPEYTDVERQAMEQGWVPKEQYKGSGKWRDAEDFLDRGSLFAKIDEQGRRIKSLDSTAAELKKHLEKVRKTEFQRALDTLRAEKKEALLDNNADAVVEIDEKITDLKTEQRIAEAQAHQAQIQQASQPHPAYIIFENRNPWYKTDKAMKLYADGIAAELVSRGTHSPAELLAEVEKQTKKEFAHKFQNPNRGRPGAVEGTSGKAGSQRKDDFQLTEEETRVMNKFVKAGHMTKEEYIADIKAERGIK
jgi:hypothetical protein